MQQNKLKAQCFFGPKFNESVFHHKNWTNRYVLHDSQNTFYFQYFCCQLSRPNVLIFARSAFPLRNYTSWQRVTTARYHKCGPKSMSRDAEVSICRDWLVSWIFNESVFRAFPPAHCYLLVPLTGRMSDAKVAIWRVLTTPSTSPSDWLRSKMSISFQCLQVRPPLGSFNWLSGNDLCIHLV